MTGIPLLAVRGRFESLASPDVEYYLVCGRTGDRPVPAAGSDSTSFDVAPVDGRRPEV